MHMNTRTHTGVFETYVRIEYECVRTLICVRVRVRVCE